MNYHQNHQPDETALESLIKILSILFYAFLLGIITLALISWVAIQPAILPDRDLDASLQYIVPLFGISGYVIGRFIYKTFLAKAKNADGNAKIPVYQTACIVLYAMMEGPSVLAIISYIVTGNHLYMGILTVLLVLFYFQKPSLYKCKEELSLY